MTAQVHRGHPAFADLLKDLVLVDCRANQGGTAACLESTRLEGVEGRVVCGGHHLRPDLSDRKPAKLTMLQRFRLADQGAVVAPKLDHTVLADADERAYLGAYSQLLSQLPIQRRRIAFSSFYLASRELPESAVRATWAPLGEQNPVPNAHDCPHNTQLAHSWPVSPERDCKKRSPRMLRMVAAVSSTALFVTSITGHSRLRLYKSWA